jgi:peptidylprolyl isomerase
MAPNKKRTPPKKSRRTLWIAVCLIAIIAVVSVVVASSNFNKFTGPSQVLLHTSMGDITIQLRSDRPITSGHFRALVEQGKYDGSNFNRVWKGSFIQGGNVSGVQSIPDELGSNNHNYQYTVAMADSGANTATSQFFINVKDNSATLDSEFTVFGLVIKGQGVVDAISNVTCIPNPSIIDDTGVPELTLPETPVLIISATMLP